MFSSIRNALILLICALALLAYTYHYGYAKARTEAKFEAIESNLRLEGEYRVKERALQEKLRKAIEERDFALSNVAVLRDDAASLRNEYEQAIDRLSTNANGSCIDERAKLTRGTKLIERSSNLIERYDRALKKSVINHKAISDLLK